MRSHQMDTVITAKLTDYGLLLLSGRTEAVMVSLQVHWAHMERVWD